MAHSKPAVNLPNLTLMSPEELFTCPDTQVPIRTLNALYASPDYLDLLSYIFAMVGLGRFKTFYRHTKGKERDGGLTYKDGTRRTPLGVFLKLVKTDQHLESQTKAQIFNPHSKPLRRMVRLDAARQATPHTYKRQALLASPPAPFSYANVAKTVTVPPTPTIPQPSIVTTTTPPTIQPAVATTSQAPPIAPVHTARSLGSALQIQLDPHLHQLLTQALTHLQFHCPQCNTPAAIGQDLETQTSPPTSPLPKKTKSKSSGSKSSGSSSHSSGSSSRSHSSHQMDEN